MRTARTNRVVLLAATLLALLPGSALAASLPSGNLLQNPGADAGQGAADLSQVFVPTGWSSIGEAELITPLQYAVPEAPRRVLSAPNLFAGGPNKTFATASQIVSVAPWRRQIDSLGVRAIFRAHLGGWETQNDYTSAQLWFLPARVRTTSLIGPNAAERNNVSGWKQRSATEQVWPGTTRIQVELFAFRREGFYNNGYADNLRLQLVADPPDRSPDMPTEHACELDRLHVAFITSQAIRSVTTTFGRRTRTDTTKPFYSVFNNVGDRASGQITFTARRTNGTTLSTRTQVPPCAPAAQQ